MEPDPRLSRVSGVTHDYAEVAALYGRCCAPLIGLLSSIGGSTADAEEVAHDAYVKLLHNWETVRDYDDPEAWVRMVAVRLMISRHRRAQVRSLGLHRLIGQARLDTPGPGPEAVAVAAALASLPVGHRAVLVLHHVLDLPVDRVATELRIPVGTVKSRLARGRAALAHLLSDEEMMDNA